MAPAGYWAGKEIAFAIHQVVAGIGKIELADDAAGRTADAGDAVGKDENAVIAAIDHIEFGRWRQDRPEC